MNTREKTVPTIPENLWRRDALLCRAAELADRMGGRLRAVSFDFFDTLVWRLVDRPLDLFNEVGRRLEHQKALRPGICGQDYESLRWCAEFKAREKLHVPNPVPEDIGLTEIYEKLRQVTPDPAAAAKVEVGVECEACQLNPGIAEFIRHIRGRGLRVVILSDMYLSAGDLKEILAANHFDASIFEFVLTSSDAGVCKGTGHLFELALKQLKLEPGQLLHIGDNYESDVIGARRAGVRAVHYASVGAEVDTILERERILLGAQTAVFNANPLRVLAARYFGGDTPEDYFARTGALLMGPIMSRFASWACEQFLSSGIRKIGAFMREGDLIASVLQREADARGYDLEVKPLFVNRRSTALAALGEPTADGIINWLENRTTLSIRNILEGLGLSGEEIPRTPFAVEERADTPEKILKLAKHIFRPETASRIEAKSAEERRKVMDYLRPWIQEDNTLGVCDLGYKASAQMQLKRIFELENNGVRMIGCYLATQLKAAERVLKGLEVRHYFGSFGKPDIYFRAFYRSPGFLEECVTAPLGTTLGYARQADGTVAPVTDRIPFSDEMLRCQKAYKEGVLMYQTLWLSIRAVKPGLLGGESEFSRRVLADLDSGARPLLARAAAFPLPGEVRHFGSLPLDDCFFADSRKILCSERDRVTLRQHGYGHILRDSDSHWPQATHTQENPQTASDFFSYAKVMLSCSTDRDTNGLRPDVAVFVKAACNPTAVRECLGRLADVENPELAIEAVIAVPKNSKAIWAAAPELTGAGSRIKARIVECEGSLTRYMNQAADISTAPFVMFIEEKTHLCAGWDAAQMGVLRGVPEIAALLPGCSGPDGAAACALTHCLLVRRDDFVSALGFEEGLGPEAAALSLLLRLRELGRKTARGRKFADARPDGGARPFLAPHERNFLRNRWEDFEKFIGSIPQAPTPTGPAAGRAGVAVSIIILAHNQLADTRQCLESLERCTPVAHEIILVDNGSTDGTTEFFRQYAAERKHVRLILNRGNLGFAAGNNQGLAVARGKHVVLLNNDTVVTEGWLERMLTALRRQPQAGLAGPVSNCVSGPQRVSAGYPGLAQLPCFAAQWSAEHAGETTEAGRLVGFCLMMRRAVVEGIGGLDPRFGSGNFEDDDFCIRARLAGFKMIIVRDSFVHHTGGQTFKGAKMDYRASLSRNWALFKAKWAMPKEAPMEQGYCLPAAVPPGVELCLALPELADTHKPSMEGRCWTDAAAAPAQKAAPAKPAQKPVVLQLPPCALAGHLGAARELLKKKKPAAAWESTVAAIQARPFHPEGFLLLAEIAQAAGDGASALLCAQRARRLAPEWKPAKKVPGGSPRGTVKPPWLVLPPALADGNGTAPRLSVCLIVKNEEKFLGQCLASVRGLAAQIIVVDTGSSDRTVEIAKEHGAEVHHLAWADDFAAARNAALEHATGDWVLSLDADEELIAEHRQTILQEMRADGVMGYRLPILNKGREQEGRSFVPRLFRNAPGLFYVGRVHEQVFSSIEVRCRQWGLQQKLGGSVIFHHGYTKEVMDSRDKIARNLRLLERAIEEMPGEPNLVMNLGLELIRSGQFDAGLEKYREAYHLMSEQPPDRIVPELRETLLTQLTTHLLTAKEFEDVAALWEMPFATSGGMTASHHFGLGLAYMELNRPADAAEQMRHCLAKRGQPALSPVNVDILKAGPNHCLALCLCALGRKEAAAEAFAAALADEPSSLRAGIDFARFQAGQGRPLEALKLLNSLAADKPAEPSVWQLGGEIALSRPEFLEFARDWTGEAVKQLPEHPGLLAQRAEALLLTGDIEGALPLWRRAASPNSARQAAAVVLCELLTGGCRRHFPAAEEAAVSRELVKWYRQLIAAGAHSPVRQLDGRMEEARAVAPGFVGVWEAATQKARGAMAAA
jgi:GT2 family glycosyltransferase/FMN phosphatase YigB (HAD superfamily)/tetratricopeptide (TPR) repeat protein